MQTVLKTKYGINHHGIPQYHEGTWTRLDMYIGSDGVPYNERRFAAGKCDDSPMVIRAYGDDPGNARYNPKCSCCWLGFSETLAHHESAVQS